MNNRNRLPILLFALFILAFPILSARALAQNITGAIVGTVKDGSGAALPNATITLTNVETNAQVTVKADESGDFVAPSLAPGLYTIKTEATGFKQNVTEAVRLLANRSVRVNIALEPGEISQRVEVQATAPVINSESATIGNILESRVITALPLNREPILKNAFHSRGFQAIYAKERIVRWEERNQCPANDRLCEEAVWFTQNMLLGARREMEQIAEAVRKIQTHAGELAAKMKEGKKEG